MSSLRPVDGGVTAPSGFRASGLHCGIKANGKPDLSLIVSEPTATAAGVFTVNLAKAAPVYLSQDHLASSGGAARRDHHQQRLRQCVYRPAGHGATPSRWRSSPPPRVGCREHHVLVASTGVIGVNLKMDQHPRGRSASGGGARRRRRRRPPRARS